MMSSLDEAGVKKLKVAELRTELQNRGLDSKGNKPVLVERLLGAISNGTKEDLKAVADEVNDEAVADTQKEATEEKEGPQEEEKPKVDGESGESQTAVTQEAEGETPSTEASVAEQMEENPSVAETVENPSVAEAQETKETVESTPNEESVAEQKDEEKKPEVEAMDTGEDVASSTTTSSKPPEDKAEKETEGEDEVEISTDARIEPEEEEIELDDSLVVLDKYNSDLHLKIAPEGLGAKVLADEGFSYLYAGARATWGVTKGKVCFECKVMSFDSVDLPESEGTKNGVRIGWSLDSARFQLGEDKTSYGFDSAGKKVHDSEFSDYGQSFGSGDVIGCYLDLESEPKTISFAKNGEDLEVAFELTEDAESKALFPHVLVKNAELSVNFGTQAEPWFPPREGFTFLQSVGEESLVHGTRGPATKKECQVIMMVGLPGSGKTTWVNKHTSENLELKFNVLGTNSIMEKMKIMGVSRKRDVGGYSKLMDKAAKCLHRLFELAPSKKRNYILDQTNVYLSAQKKKMRPFEGFTRRAIVCIPTQDELKKRTEDRKKEGIELPENAVSDMKMSFTLPKVGEFFEEVVYADQSEEASKTIVDEYIKEGRTYRSRSGPGSDPPFKRSRFDDRPRYGGGYARDRAFDDRGGYRRGGGSYQSFGRRSHHGHGGGGYRGGRGGYHDKRDHRGGGRGGGGYGGGGYGGGGYGGGYGGSGYGGGSYGGGGYGGGHRQQSSYRQQHHQSSPQYRPRHQQNYNQQQRQPTQQHHSPQQQQSHHQPSYSQQQQQQQQQYGSTGSSSYNQYYSYNQSYQSGYQQPAYAQQQQSYGQQQPQQQAPQQQQAQQQAASYQNYQGYYGGYQQQPSYGSYGY